MSERAESVVFGGKLRRVLADDVGRSQGRGIDEGTRRDASVIIEDVRARGMEAVREHGERLGDIKAGEPVIVRRERLLEAVGALEAEPRRILTEAAERVKVFAGAQRRCLVEMERGVAGTSGVRIGHTIAAVERAGCYAPGGRFALPSSVLMTVCTARAAGVEQVWLCSPRPGLLVQAAAGIAGADALLTIGGAQGIAAMALGAAPVPRCDVVVGPGNRWVTAAKQLLYGQVGLDMLAGPSEVLIIADGSADAKVIAADMLAQAEHDTDAAAWLVTTSEVLLEDVERELERQLATLPTAEIARKSLCNGGAVLCGSIEEAVGVSDRIAPEHLEVMTVRAEEVAKRCRNYGGIFVGMGAAEVVGDYCLGPNHTLPTGGTSRFAGGLSVFAFLRVRTFIEASGLMGADVYRDVAAFARMEGLEGHARAAEMRIVG